MKPAPPVTRILMRQKFNHEAHEVHEENNLRNEWRGRDAALLRPVGAAD
jgi:hypothetical protein